MFALRVVQAEFGDCLILEYGTADAPRYMLIDGGPEDIFADHLSSELQRIRSAGGGLDLVVLSHVDNDHILGLLDWTAEMQGTPEQDRIGVGGLWHNAFSQTVDPGNEIATRVRTAATSSGVLGFMSAVNATLLGIGEGSRLRANAAVLGFKMNDGFQQKLVSLDTSPEDLQFGNVKVKVVGPTQANLDALRDAWMTWLEKHEEAIALGKPHVAAMADLSVPNLSSIQLHVQADGKSMLLTGDGRGDHLLQGLEAAGLLDDEGGIDVDLLKVAHHGSDRNVNRKFFERVRAKTYVMSANGKNDNPDLMTMVWIAQAAKKQNRDVTMFVTNETLSTQKIIEECPQNEFPYTLEIMSREESSRLMQP
jgi:hypothetical protein